MKQLHALPASLWKLADAVYRPGSKISGRKGQDKLASLPQTPEPRCGTLRAGPKTNRKLCTACLRAIDLLLLPQMRTYGCELEE